MQAGPRICGRVRRAYFTCLADDAHSPRSQKFCLRFRILVLIITQGLYFVYQIFAWSMT